MEVSTFTGAAMHYKSKASTQSCPGCGNRFVSTAYNNDETSAGELMACHLIGRRECTLEYWDSGLCIEYGGHFLIPDAIHINGFGGVWEVVGVNDKAQKVVLERYLERQLASSFATKLKSFGRVNQPKPTWRG